MSVKETILRYHTIITKLQRFPATSQQLLDKLAKESELTDYDLTRSKRTLLRDIADISSIYNIDIVYNHSIAAYEIDYESQTEAQERVLEALNTFNALNFSDKIANSIHFEKRKTKGTENLHGILHAIKNKFQLRFTYQKFWDEVSTNRIVEPYALKEFKNRWYILANDMKDNVIKTFALDRLNDLEITHAKFKFHKNFDTNQYFKNCFGIVSPDGKKPEEIILSFEPFKGKYIKSLPLHESQEILIDNQKELRIKLFIVITYDFVIEILSHGHRVKVMKPTSLVDELKSIYSSSLQQYN